MGLLELLIILLLISWIGGFGLHIGGDLIHLLIVVALILFIYNFLRKRGWYQMADENQTPKGQTGNENSKEGQGSEQGSNA